MQYMRYQFVFSIPHNIVNDIHQEHRANFTTHSKIGKLKIKTWQLVQNVSVFWGSAGKKGCSFTQKILVDL